MSCKLTESCPYKSVDCGRGGSRQKKKKSPGWWTPAFFAPVAWESRAIEEVDVVHALWLHCVHARVGRCKHSGVALGLHLSLRSRDSPRPCPRVTTTCNSWSLHRERYYHIDAAAHEAFSRRRKVRRWWNLQLFQLGEWWSGRPSPPRCARKNEILPNYLNSLPAFLFCA